jgi:hypothetical protein
MPLVYSATEGLPTKLPNGWEVPWQRIDWHRSNNDIMQPVADDEPPILRDDAEEIVKATTTDLIGFNLEPTQSGCYRFLSQYSHRKEAIFAYQTVVEAVSDARPEAELVIYRGNTSARVTKDPEQYLEKDAAFHVEYADVLLPYRYVAFSAYQKDLPFDVWQARMDYEIGIIRGIYGKEPLAFVWDGAGGWKKGIGYTAFSKQLEHLGSRGVDLCYWSFPYEVVWDIQFALWEYTEGKFS